MEAETRTGAGVVRVLRRTCSPVRNVMVDEGGRRGSWERVEKKAENRFAENETVHHRVTNPFPYSRGEWSGEIIGHTLGIVNLFPSSPTNPFTARH